MGTSLGCVRHTDMNLTVVSLVRTSELCQHASPLLYLLKSESVHLEACLI